MLLSIQFPLADCRRFIPGADLLGVPAWPLPTPDVEFVRFFGSVRLRKLGGVGGWVGEGEICEAARAVRLTGCPVIHSQGIRVPTRCSFRRFYSDGLATSKFELGISTKRDRWFFPGKSEMRSFVANFLETKVRVPTPRLEDTPISLVRAGQKLAKLYLLASSRGKPATGVEPANWWVRSGSPLAFWHFRGSENPALQSRIVDHFQSNVPFWIRPVHLNIFDNALLYHCIVPTENTSIRMWILCELGSFFRKGDRVRSLRLHLLRMHAEHECLRLVLKSILEGKLTVQPRSTHSNSLQAYFLRSMSIIGRLESKSSRFDDEITQLTRQSLNTVDANQVDALIDVLERFDLRGNVLRSLRQYAKDWSNITIIENVERYQMGDSFENISNSIITTRGSIANSIISLRDSGNSGAAKAIEDIDRIISSAPPDVLPEKEKAKGLELVKGIAEESKKPTPSKPILGSLGESLWTLLSSFAVIAQNAKSAFDVLKSLWS